MRVAWRTVGAIITRVWAGVEALHDRFAGLARLGINERRPHHRQADHPVESTLRGPRPDLARLTAHQDLRGNHHAPPRRSGADWRRRSSRLSRPARFGDRPTRPIAASPGAIRCSPTRHHGRVQRWCTKPPTGSPRTPPPHRRVPTSCLLRILLTADGTRRYHEREQPDRVQLRCRVDVTGHISPTPSRRTHGSTQGRRCRRRGRWPRDCRPLDRSDGHVWPGFGTQAFRSGAGAKGRPAG
jgi:hypothetical protein